MLIKILGNNEVQFRENLESVMNIACVVARRGSLPTERDINERQPKGFWYENIEEKVFDLLPVANNHKAFVRERGKNYVIVEFYSRYGNNKEESLSFSKLLLAIFQSDQVQGVVSREDIQHL